MDSTPQTDNPPLIHNFTNPITPDHSPTPSPPPPPPDSKPLIQTDVPELPPTQPSAPTTSTSAPTTSNQLEVAVIPPPQTEKPSTTAIPQTKNPNLTFAGTKVLTQTEIEKHKKKKEHHGNPSKVHIKLKDATSLTDAEVGQLLKTLADKAKTRSEQRHKELDDKVEE